MKKISIVAAVLFTSLSVPALAFNNGTDCATAKEKRFSQLLENGTMRLLEFQLNPGEAADVHGHPEHQAYAVTHATLRITTPDGKTEEINVKPGDLLWLDATNYKTENVGDQDFRAIVYEAKAGNAQPPQRFFSLFSK